MKLTVYQGYFCMNDDFTGYPIVWFSKIAKEADMNYSKQIIYEIFDYLNMSKYIRSLMWVDGVSKDSIYHYLPIVTWIEGFPLAATDEETKYMKEVPGELIHYLCKAWNKSVND